MILNVRDFETDDPSFDAAGAALAAAADGDVVYFPAGQYTAPDGGWQLTKSLQIRGDGPGQVGLPGGTVLMAPTRNSPVFVIVPPSTNTYVRDLQLVSATSGSSANGVGIRCIGTATAGAANLRLGGLLVSGFDRNGVELHGYSDTAGLIDSVLVLDCEFVGCGRAGLSLKHAAAAHVSNCVFRDNGYGGLSSEACSIAVYGSTFDGNCTSVSGAPEANLTFLNCQSAKAEACRFLGFNAGTIRKACLIDGGMASVGSCFFDSGNAAGSASGIVVTRSTPGQPMAGPVTILGNHFANTAALINVDSNVTNCLILGQYDEGAGSVIIPQPDNNGLVGAPHIVRAEQFETRMTGLILPSGATDPAVAYNGMLTYNTYLKAVRVFIGRDPNNPAVNPGAWKSIKFIPKPPPQP